MLKKEIDRGLSGDREGVKIERHHTLELSTGRHRFFVRSHRGGAQFVLFNLDKVLVASGTLEFGDMPWPRLRPESNQAFPVDEVEAWMRTWPPEDRLLLDVLSLPLRPLEG